MTIHPVRAELGLPDAAHFEIDEDGEVHIASAFGDTWCADFRDEPPPDPIHFRDNEVTDVDRLCRLCVNAALEDQ